MESLLSGFPLSLPRKLIFPTSSSKSYASSSSSSSSIGGGSLQIDHPLQHQEELGNNNNNILIHASAAASCSSSKEEEKEKKVVWRVEADIDIDIEAGQVLYLTGDPIALGCWNPDSAIPMSNSSNSCIWEANLLLPLGIHFTYNYFIRDGKNKNLICWRPGPQHSLLMPPTATATSNNNILLLTDTWLNTPRQHSSLSNYSWDSWLQQPSSATDDHIPTRQTNHPQPVEEPWLHHSFLSINYKHTDHHTKLTPSLSTVILINSSVCTMQRIAILEDEKLVELLLEPVKNNVQCDSVYLGIITKLVPNMGGAFVNIGIPRPSLMDIKHSREPFIFPPFRRRPMENDIKDQRLETTHNQPAVANINGFQQLLFQDEDFEEHEFEDDSDAPIVPQKNVNGSMMDCAGGLSDYDTYNYKNHFDTADNDKFLLTHTDGSGDSQFSHHAPQDMKNFSSKHPEENKWDYVRKGTKVIVQVVKEGLGTKGPTLTAYPNLRSRFWILSTRCDRIGVSKKVLGVERTRLRVIAKTLQPPGFGLTVRTVAAGHSLEELQKDLEGLLSTWKSIIDHAKSAALAADEGVEGAVPVILHRAMGQTLSVAQDYFNEKVKGMIVDSPRTYHEITSYLQEIAPDLCERVELYDKKSPIFDEYGIEEEINNMLSKRVPLANGGSLVIEQTEALVSIDVNGGHGMLGDQGNSQEKAILEVNLAAAKQIAKELRLRDVGGIIVVDFIDMVDDSNKRLVFEEVKRAVERDRSTVRVSELSRHGLMEITRKRVRPSVTFMISEPCSCCHATGRVEALETCFSKIEHEICRLLATMSETSSSAGPKSWPKLVLRVDRYMCNYLTSGKRTRLALLSSSLRVWILLKVARGFPRGAFDLKPFLESDTKNNNTSLWAAPTTLTLFPLNNSSTPRRHK